jgi:hypothetical protein
MLPSRVVQNYQLDLTAQDDPSTHTYTYTVYATPTNRSSRVRWFFLDQTGMTRAGMGAVGPWSPPAS